MRQSVFLGEMLNFAIARSAEESLLGADPQNSGRAFDNPLNIKPLTLFSHPD